MAQTETGRGRGRGTAGKRGMRGRGARHLFTPNLARLGAGRVLHGSLSVPHFLSLTHAIPCFTIYHVVSHASDTCLAHPSSPKPARCSLDHHEKRQCPPTFSIFITLFCFSQYICHLLTHNIIYVYVLFTFLPLRGQRVPQEQRFPPVLFTEAPTAPRTGHTAEAQ